MKKIILVLFALSFVFLNAQSQTNNSIPTSGAVGIGTTTPSTKLQVCGAATFDSTVIIKDTLKLEKDLIIDQNVIVNGDFNLKSQQGTGYDLLWIDNTGKIIRGGGPGLGGSLLDEVYTPDCVQNPDGTYPNPGWSNRPGVIYTDENCPPDVKIGVTTRFPQARVHIVEKTTTDDILKLSTLTTPDILVVENDGKTGIGINNPEARLHIFDPTTSDDILLLSTALTPYIMKVENNGKIGIGTNTPNAHLHIYGTAGTSSYIRFENASGTQFKVEGNGYVTCREVKVTLGTIADYVYDESYELMSIEDYETYVKQNKHLPGVPSQKDVEDQGGIDVGEFQVKLLEKIEEMSLYLFELKKQMEELKKKNEELEDKISSVEK